MSIGDGTLPMPRRRAKIHELDKGVQAERRQCHNHAKAAKSTEGSHIQSSSLARTSRPRSVKKQLTPMGETRMGRRGKK